MMNYTEEVTEGEGDEKTTKMENKTEQVNAATALWTLSKSELKKEDYVEFYKTIGHDHEEPLTYLHNRVEGAKNLQHSFISLKKHLWICIDKTILLVLNFMLNVYLLQMMTKSYYHRIYVL